ncbi:hypothetical protein DSCW_25960 [Desulfosarcina widdelii]|uniref:Lipoprotein n=1 Tax=Desulfosarcina widdelii TaxID=947919 RepID=A0A5K7Z4Q1_9BACT|nr:hypothetical protein [Desulfosarcina widdelii]BBO75179.1 hypothetical protein DSCW_25960 [Desulfosarcina widdelii]
MDRQWIAALAIAALIAGCAASPQPFEYHDDRDEKPGPGLFSGDRGGVVVYGESSKQTEEKEATEDPSPK